MPMVNTLSTLLLMMTGVLAAISIIGVFGTSALIGVAALAALGLVIWELGAILHAMREYNLGEAMPMVNTLSALLKALVSALVVLTGVGVFGIAALSGVVIFGTLALELALLMAGLAAIKDTASARANIESIIMLLASLTNMIMIIAAIGSDSIVAVAALAGIILIVEKLAVFATTAGALANMFGAGVGTAIEKGLDILKIIARGLGEAVSAFVAGSTTDLPVIADNLAKFMEKINPFISSISVVGEDVATGAGNLMKAILAIVGADAITSALEFFSGGKISLSDLALELKTFAENIIPFMDSMKGVDSGAATGVESLCNAINSLTSANLKDAFAQFLFGDNSLSSFGENIAAFASSIKNASISLAGITDEDVNNIKRSATAGTALAELNDAIPRSGGLWQDIAGEKDLSTWGTKISAFADSLIAYSTKISGSNIDKDAIQNSADAATAVATLNNNIPKDGGFWQDIAGSKNLADWGTKICTFADALIQYSAKISGASIDKQAILDSAEGAAALAEVNNAIPTSGGLWDAIAGGKDLSSFGSGLSSLATGIANYANAAAGLDETKIEAIKNSGTAVEEIEKVVNKLPNTGGGWGMLWGEKDPLSFGAGVTSLADGIKSCILVATAITTDDIDKLGNVKEAIAKIETVVKNIPNVDTSQTDAFKSGVIQLKGACDVVSSMTDASYDFSGIDTIKAEITNIATMFSGVSFDTLKTDIASLSQIATDIVSSAETIAKLNNYTYGGVDTLKGALNSLSDANVDGVINKFADKAGSMSAAVNQMVSSLSVGLTTGSSSVSTAASGVADAAVNAISTKGNNFKTIGADLIAKLADGIKSKNFTAYQAGSGSGTQAASGVKSSYYNMYSAGMDLAQGLINGINAMKTQVYNAAFNLGKQAVLGEKAGQQSNSPSKATIKAGKWLGEGLVIGMNRMGDSVYNAGVSMGENAVGSISRSISTISDAINTDIDSQPTIRPVLDLSDVRAGAGAIGGLLGAGAPIGVHANIDSISSMMNARSQNGTNSDIVSAIDKLRKDLSNVGNTTYQVNGVTYDDGSNIVEAVKTITRAAVRERRI